jgi:hypothetical protein
MIVFMHIPKTAGSSVNRVFRDHFGPERVLEQCHLRPDLNFRSFEFVSGHSDWFSLSTAVKTRAYSFTFIREPVEHLLSHLAWVKALNRSDRQTDFDAHDVSIQAIARELSDVDLTDADAIDYYLTHAEGYAATLFKNAQARYFLRPGVDNARPNQSTYIQAASCFRRINRVGVSDMISATLAFVFFDNGITPTGELTAHVNVGLDRPTRLEGHDRLLKHVALDAALYAWARST